jgi:hypothetical protein
MQAGHTTCDDIKKRRVSLFNGMEQWNGIVEWNGGMEWNGMVE